jgi:single-stranded DNA-binding protein
MTSTIAVGVLAEQPRATRDRDQVAVLVLIVDVPADPERARDEPIRYQVKATGPLAEHAARQLDQGDAVVVVGTVRRERYRLTDTRPSATVDWLVATTIARNVGVPAKPTPPAPRPLTLVRPEQRTPQVVRALRDLANAA